MTSPAIAQVRGRAVLAERLGTATSRLQALLRRQLAQAEITISQARTLSTLATRGPHRVTDLAVIEQVAQPTMSALVARLSDNGLVERRPDPSDPKAMLIFITRPGLDHWRSLIALRTDLLASGLALLSASEKKSLEAALPALEHLVEKLQGAGIGAAHGRR
ncbi:MAG: MarR family winged helix-turn-helix transcriptional regulator [Candidatus Dormibacteraceae bacterium]